MTELEGGYAALAVPSGLTATTFPLLALARPGDHVLVTDVVYGPTRRFCENHLRRLGIAVTYYDPLIDTDIEALFRDNTRIVFLESPGSLTFEVQDVAAITAAARARGVLSILTTAGRRRSASAPSITASTCPCTRRPNTSAVTRTYCSAPSSPTRVRTRRWRACGRHGHRAVHGRLLSRPARLANARRTLARHQDSALRIAAWLREREEVAEVLYPALDGARGHALWRRDFKAASGLFGVILHPVDKARIDAMLDGMRLFGMGWSWGGFESLIIPTYPARTRSVTQWQGGGTVAASARGPRGPGRSDRGSGGRARPPAMNALRLAAIVVTACCSRDARTFAGRH
jgi:cystathionine beta-lyase